MAGSVFDKTPTDLVLEREGANGSGRGIGAFGSGTDQSASGALPPNVLKTAVDQAAIRYNVPANLIMAITEMDGGSQAPMLKIDGVAKRLQGELATGKRVEDVLTPDVLARADKIGQDLYPPPAPAPKPAPVSQQKGSEDQGPGVLGTAKDMVLQATGGIYKGTGSALRGLGHMSQQFAENVTAPIVNRIFGTDIEPTNLADPAADAIEKFGEAGQSAVSKDTQEAIKNSTPDGDLLKPSTWTLGKAPSLRGYTALALDIFGSMAPVVAAGVIGGPAAGALAGGLQGGGAAIETARDIINDMAKVPEDGSEPEIAKQSAYYRAQRDAGKSHEQAVRLTRQAAERMAFAFTMPVSAMGGAATAKIVHPAEHLFSQQALIGRVAGRAALGGLEEGAQEASETVATRHGVNEGAGTDLSVTDGTFSDFLLGALGGAGTGAAGGAFSTRDHAAPEQAVSAAAQEPTFADPPAQIEAPQAAPEEMQAPPPAEPTGPIGRAIAAAPVPAAVAEEAPPVEPTHVLVHADGIEPFAATVETQNEAGVVLRDEAGNRYEIPAEEMRSGAVTIRPAEEAKADDVVEQAEPEGSATETPSAAEAPVAAGSEQTAEAPAAEGDQSPAKRDKAASPQPEATVPATRESLLGRLDYLTSQARINGGWSKLLSTERAKVEAQLAAMPPEDVDAAAAPGAEGNVGVGDADGRGVRGTPQRGSDEGAAGRAGDGASAAPSLRSSEPVTHDALTTDAGAHEAATSPHNDRPEPTQAQKEAGNYKVGRISVGGLDISVENPQGSTRSGVDRDGKAWSVEMKSHYGYIRGTVGKDKDHVDVLVRPGVSELPDDAKVFVVDQRDPQTGAFDEHKVMLGFDSQKQAQKAYLANYAKGWRGLGAITPMSMSEFRSWVRDPAKTSKPAGTVADRSEAAPAQTDTVSGEVPASEPKVTRLNDDFGNYVLDSGAQLYSDSGRALAPSPKADVSTPRKRNRTLFLQREWLIDEARKEAAATGNNHMGRMFEAMNATNISRSDMDTLNEFLFGSEEPGEANFGPRDTAPAPRMTAAETAKALADMPLTRSTPDQVQERRNERRSKEVQPNPSAAIGATQEITDGFTANREAMAREKFKPGEAVEYDHEHFHRDGTSRTFAGKVVKLSDKDQGIIQVRQDGGANVFVAASRLRRTTAKTGTEAPPTAEPGASEQTPGYGASNTFITADRAAELRNQLKAKLRNQLNSGIDPEVLAIGAQLAAYHIEAGARSFSAWAQAMARDLDTTVAKIRPYLRAWYNGARDMMEDVGLDIAGTDDPAVVKAALANLAAEEAPNEPAKLDQRSAGALEGAPAEEVQGASEGRASEGGSGARGGADASGNERAGERRVRDTRGVGDGARTVSVPARGADDGRARGERSGESVQRPDAAEQRTAARAERPEVEPASGVAAPARGSDFAHPDTDIGRGGAKTKFRNNVAAIRILRELGETDRPATRDEQVALSKFVGWGGLPQAFFRSGGDVTKGWEKEARELKELLTPEEYRAAEASTRNAHYTSPEIVQAMWGAVRHLGFKSGRVLEPSVGAGNFFGLMPPELRNASALTGVELDHVTGGIAKHLYPAAKIAAPMGFQDFTIPDGHFDLVIGNPPFGAEKLYDPRRKDLSGFSIHNYFFAKSLDALRPNGILAMVVTNRMMDAASDKARQYMVERAELLGAIRLPNNAFLANAGTEVTTDIIFMRKRAEGETAKGESWMEVSDFRDKNGATVPLNEYFLRNPDQMLGEFGAFGTMYRADDAALVAREDQDTADLLEEAIHRLPQGVMTASAPKVKSPEPARSLTGAGRVRVGSMFRADDGTVMVRKEDGLGEAQAEPVTFASDKAAERVGGMLDVRDHFSDLRALQLDPKADDTQIEAARARLNAVYDAFVKAHGPINADANKRLFRDDPSWPQISALEQDFDKGLSAALAQKTGEQPRKPSAKKAAVFSRRTQRPYTPPSHAASAKDTLVASLSETGRVDPELMSRLYGKPADAIMRELDDLVFKDPVRGWVTRDDYLSGNVKRKLAEAREAVKSAPELRRNVEALEAVQPADVAAVDISVKPGAHWVPAAVMKDFASHISGDDKASAHYNPSTARWIIGARGTAEQAARWGTGRVSVMEVIEAASNQRTITVRDRLSDGSTPVNETETQLANDKVRLVSEEWRRWLWQDDGRREDLARLYNDMFNTDVLRRFDGSHLTFPGKVGDDVIALRPHQANAVWRIVQSGATLLDHVVGAGKTFTMVAAAMELRRMGLARKPMFVVPNHLVGQWAKDFLTLYPGANVLATTKADFDKANRKRLFARIATGDWDAVIVAHSSFGKVEVEPAAQAEFIEDQIADLQQSQEAMREAEGKDGRNVKQIQTQIANRREKMKKLLDAGAKDDSLYWGELGVDALFTDEAHEFKNLEFSTSMQRVAGLGNTSGSQKASDMYLKKLQVKKATGGRNLIDATGTPISNTMAEMFTFQRYLDGDNLKAQGLAHFDAWARNFGEVVTDWELAPSGQYKLNSRFARFVNMPELLQRYRSFADVIDRDDINAMLAAQGKKLPVPKVKGGKPENVVVERSPQQAAYIGVPEKDAEGNDTDRYPRKSLIGRSENLPKRPGKGEDNMLKIMSDARKAALDMRLIDPSYPDYEGSKINQAVKSIKALYDRWHADKGVQLVFIDLSTPKAARGKEAERIRDLVARAEAGDEAANEALDKLSPDELSALDSAFSVYDDMKAKLVAAGIPEAEVAFIHDANTEIQKEELFGKVRSGRVRVLFGSTQKMGAGTNVQTRLVALHHMDAPWRPSDLEQREGRIIRQGNELYERDPDGFEVAINRYATKQTLDSRMWQTIEAKARFIEQVRKGGASRDIEDVGGEAANAAEMKAASSGNPLVLEEMSLRQAVRRLANERYGHDSEQFRLRDNVKRMRASIAWNRARAGEMEADAKIELPSEFAMTINGEVFEARKDAGAAILHAAKMLEATYGDHAPLGSYGGFEMTLDRLPGKANFTVTLKGEGEYQIERFQTDADAVGLAMRITNAVKGLGTEAQELARRADRDEATIPRLEAQVAPWPKAAELAEAEARHKEVIDKLKPAKKAQPVDGDTKTPTGAKYSIADKDVVHVPLDEVRTGESMTDLRKRIRELARSLLKDKVVTTRDGHTVTIAWQGIKHGTESASRSSFAVLLKMDEVLAASVLESSHPDKDGRPEILAMHRYGARVSLDGKPADVTVFVREVHEGKRYYHHLVLEQESPSGIPGNVSVETEPSDQPAEGPVKKIAPGWVGFKSISDAQHHLRSGAYGIQIARMMDAGRVVIHRTQADLPGAPESEGRIQAMTDGSGTVHLVAENLTPENVKGVLLHELFHAGAANVLGSQRYTRLMKRVRTALEAAEARAASGEAGGARTFWDAALARVKSAGVPAELRAEELAAYAIEHRETAPAGIREVVDGIVGAVKEWALRVLGLQVGDVTPGQLSSLARTILLRSGADATGDGKARYSLVKDRASGNPATPAEQDAWFKHVLSDTLTQSMPALLATAPLRPMLEELGKGLPAAQAYLRTKQQMDTLRNEWHAKVAEVTERWRKFVAHDPAENKVLMEVMHEATLSQNDPSAPFKPRFTAEDATMARYGNPDSAEYHAVLRKAEEEKGRRADYKALKERFDKLSPEAKELFATVRDSYSAMADAFERIILENMDKSLKIAVRRAEREHRKDMQRIVDEGLQGKEREEAVKNADRRLATVRSKTTWNARWRLSKMRAQFESNRMVGPYFPLTRFGDFFVTVRDKGGKVVSFSRFESARKQRLFSAEMRRDPDMKVEVGVLSEGTNLRNQVDPHFVADVEEMLAGAEVPDSLKDDIWQRYLETLPDYSIRKRRIHRIGRAGFQGDALRAFASNMFHGAHQLARTKFSMDLNEHLKDAREQAKDAPDPVRAGLVVNEMEKRDAYIMNPQGAWWSQAISTAAFVYHLSMSPAAAMVNVSQTVMIGVPVLGAYIGGRRGIVQAGAGLIKASRDFALGKGRAENSSSLSADEKAAMSAAYNTGIIDKSQAHDLAGVGETGVRYNATRQKVMGALSWAFHQTERFNREVTFLAAYRAARAKGVAHDTAVNEAGRLTWKTHFDYQNTSRPRLMHGNTARAVLIFRNYNINMLFRLFRDTHQALYGATVAEKREARTQLLGVTAMMAANAGIKGTWMFGAAMAFAGIFFALGGSDDDPEEEVQKALVGLFGPTLGGVLLNGVPGHLTGTALSERIGMPDLWFRSPDRQLEGDDAWHFWADQMLGAGAGIIQNGFRGVQMMREGNVYRGIETIAPKAIRDLMRSYRYLTDGAQTLKGDALVEDVPVADAIKQALGFTPAQIAERYQLNGWMKNREQAILKERGALTTGYAKAARDGDEAAISSILGKIDTFNAKNPDNPITGRTLSQSYKAKVRASDRNDGGINLNPKLNDRIRQESAPEIYN